MSYLITLCQGFSFNTRSSLSHLVLNNKYIIYIILDIIHKTQCGIELKNLEKREKEKHKAKWSDGNKFTLCLALVCRVRSITACLPALMGNGRLIAKFPLRRCGQPSPQAHTHTHTHTHTHRQMPPPSYAPTCTCTHFLTVIYLPMCVHTVAREQGHFGLNTRGVNKAPLCLETSIWPDIANCKMSVLYSQGKKGSMNLK